MELSLAGAEPNLACIIDYFLSSIICIWVAIFFIQNHLVNSGSLLACIIFHIQNLGPVFIYVLDNHMAHNSCEVFEALCRIICAMLLFLEIGWVALICRSRRRYCCS